METRSNIVAMVQKDIEKSLQDIQEGKYISADEYEKGIAIETVTKFVKSADGKTDSEKIALASQKLTKFGYTAKEVDNAIATVMRKLQPPDVKEILLISQNPTLNRKEKKRIIREIRRKLKEEQRSNGEGYRDLTADAAVARVEKERKNDRANKKSNKESAKRKRK